MQNYAPDEINFKVTIGAGLLFCAFGIGWFLVGCWLFLAETQSSSVVFLRVVTLFVHFLVCAAIVFFRLQFCRSPFARNEIDSGV